MIGTTGPPDAPTLCERIRATRLVAFDFDGVFTDNTVYVMQDGSEAVRCWRGDGLGLQKLAQAGIVAVVISRETNPVVTARARKLGVRCVQGCEDKLTELERLTRQIDLSLPQVAFVGNDINDLCCLTQVGLPIVVYDAHPDVIPHALYRTKLPGGRGAVREICDLFERVLASSAEQSRHGQ